jgi:hypothetical protein
MILRGSNAFFRFWDLLHISTWYTHQNEWSQQCDYIQIGYLVIFLVLHTTTSSRPVSPPRQSYDDVWPSENGLQTSQQTQYKGNSPPSSPNKPLQRKGMNVNSSQTPLSPRSTRLSPGLKRSGSKSPSSYYKSSAQHLSFTKEKLSTIVHALSLQDSGTAEHDCGIPLLESINIIRLGTNAGSNGSGILSIGISSGLIDSLGLILGCGPDEKNEV